MADRINCRNCIHFHEDDQRCHLNDNDFIQKECYFRLGRRTPKGKDIVIEELKKKQNQIAIEELEKLKDEFDSSFSDDTYSAHKIMDKIDEYIEKLKG